MTRSDYVVPFAMEALRVEIDVAHFSLRHRSTGRILPPIQPTGHRQAFRGRGPGNELHDGLVVAQGFATPVRRDEGEESVFDLVPFARTRREVTHRNGHAGLVRQALEFEFPEAQTPSVAAARIAVISIVLAPG